MNEELAYSFHLGSDKNKSKVAKKVAKGNVSGTTSISKLPSFFFFNVAVSINFEIKLCFSSLLFS